MRADLSGLAEPALFTPGGGRLLLNVLMLAAESLPRGGTVVLRGGAAEGLVVLLDGPMAAWPDSLPGLIADPQSAAALLQTASPRDVQAPLTVMMAATGGHRLSLLLGAAVMPPLLVSLREG